MFTILPMFFELVHEENHLSRNHSFVGFLVKTQVKKLLGDGDITKKQYDMHFNKNAFLYALENVPLNNDLLKHARVFIFLARNAHLRAFNFSLKNLKVLCCFHFSTISSNVRGASVVTIHYLTRF